MTYGLDNSFSFLYLFFLAVIVVIILIIIYDNKKKRKKREKILRKIIMSDYNNPTSLSTEKDCERLPYRKKLLLTKNEYWFYKSLKGIADKYSYAVLAKIRLADLVEVSSEIDKNEYMKYFAKIRSKHIDFILCKKDNLYPELLIELNDNSHKTEDRAKRDELIEKICEKVGYKIIFVYGTQSLEENIKRALKINDTNNNDPPVAENTEKEQQ